MALAKLNRERQQKRLRDTQELTKCLSSGMGLLTPEQVRQITNAVTGTDNEPMDALRSFNERLEILREENPHASEADLREVAEGVVQAIVARAKNEREQQQKPGTRQTVAAFEVPREALHPPDSRRGARQHTPGPPSAGRCGEQNPRLSRCTTTSVASGPPARGDREPQRGSHQKLLQSSEFGNRTCIRGSQQRGRRQGVGPCCSRRHASRGGGVHGHIVAGS